MKMFMPHIGKCIFPPVSQTAPSELFSIPELPWQYDPGALHSGAVNGPNPRCSSGALPDGETAAAKKIIYSLRKAKVEALVRHNPRGACFLLSNILLSWDFKSSLPRQSSTGPAAALNQFPFIPGSLTVQKVFGRDGLAAHRKK